MLDFTKRVQNLVNLNPDYFYSKTYQRHLDDLTNLDNSFRFNYQLGELYITVMESFVHSKGPLIDQQFILEEWQRVLIIIATGWEILINNIWVRRFSTINIFLSRKNGKTILSSGLAIADSIIRNQGAGEIVSCATKSEQALLSLNESSNMIFKHPDFKKIYRRVGNKLINKIDNGMFFVLGKDSSRNDGMSVSVGIVDEYHAHPNSDLFDIIKSSQGARLEPLMIIISTAGFNLASPLVQELEYASDILLNNSKDERYFAFLAKMDPDDDPYDFKNLYKSNPNMGVSVSEDFLLQELELAKVRVDKRTNYLTKYCNKFVASNESFINLDDWKASAINTDEDIDLTKSVKCLIGADLSISGDLSAIVQTYLFEDDTVYIKSKFWLPEKTIQEQQARYRVPFETWIAQNHIIATPGDYIDYDTIYEYIAEIIKSNEELNIETEVYYDAYKFRSIKSQLENQLGFVDSYPVSQGFLTSAEPLTLLKTYIQRRTQLIHDNNPIMNWCISNADLMYDSYGNIKLDKSSKYKKIDGVSALNNTFVGILGLLQNQEQDDMVVYL